MCRAYVFQLRWPEGFRCPRCGHGKAWAARATLWQCCQCDHQTSVTAGTVFQDTRKPLKMWFRAMWYVTSQKKGASALGLQRVLGLGSYQTAWAWLHKLRRAMVRPGRDHLIGWVEVDETYVGGWEEGMKGRRRGEKSLVVIAAQVVGNGIGRIRMRVIPDASAGSLLPFIEGSVEPGSTIHTDGWQGYSGIAKKGYGHEISPIRGRPREASKLLPRVHRVGIPAETLVARHPPGCGGTSASGLLPGRVHFSLQSPHIQESRQAVLSAYATGSSHRTDHLCRNRGA